MVDVDTSRLDALERRMTELAQLELSLGIMGPDGGATGPHPDGDGLSIADVAALHEFGTDTLVARPIVRGYLADGGESEIARDMARLTADVIAGADPKAAMDALVAKHAKAMRLRFDRGIGPAIADEPEGGDPRPLHDTGAIGDSIRGHVEVKR